MALVIAPPMNYLAIAALAVLASAGGAITQESSILRYRLDNGLDVILVPQHRAPTVVVDIGYKVGAMNEPPGRSGFAHLFEHLMFMGTAAVPDIDVAYGALGVDVNASTWDDHTLYYARGLASSLPQILSVEADRMANQGAGITAADLELEREVVLNEIRQNVFDNVNGAAWEALPAALFPASHPYSRSIYGSIADLKAATIEDVHAFFDTYYGPNNAVLAVVGDFEPDAVKAMIAETFGRVPRGADVAPVAPPVPPPTRARLELEDRVPTPTLLIGWAVPPIRERDLSLLRVAGELLGNPDYGVLRRALVDTGLASNAWVHLTQGVLASRLILEINAAEGVDPAAVEAAARKAMADFIASPLSEADFNRERTRLFLTDAVGNEDPLKLADNLLIYAQAMDDPGFALDDDRHIAAASAADVIAAASRWLAPDDVSIAVIRPGARGGYPKVLTESTGTPEVLPARPRPTVAIPMLAPGDPVPAPLPQSVTATLSNGITLVHYPMPDAPMAYLAARTPVGTLAAPAGKEGIVELATAMAVRGAGVLPAADLGRAIRDLGGDFNAEPEALSSFITLSVPPANLAPAAALLGDVLRRPRFDAAEWEIAKAETLNELALREGDLADVAGRYGEWALFPRAPGQPAVDRSLASVRLLTRDEAAAAFPRIFSPANVSFISVGAAPLEDIVAALEASFGDWTASTEPFPTAPREPATFPEGKRVLVVPEPGAAQAALYVAVPAPGPAEPEHPPAIAVHRLLNVDFISRINSVIREELAYTYGTDGELMGDVREGSALVIEAPVDREVAGAALEEIFTAIVGLATDPVREDELQRTIAAYQVAMAATAETAGGLFEAIWKQLGNGSSLEEAHARRLAVAGLDLEIVQARARAMASLDRVLVVAVGDPEVIVPQLEAIGLKPELVERRL